MKGSYFLVLIAAILFITPCEGQKYTIAKSCPQLASTPITLANLVNTWRIYSSTHHIHDPFLRCAQITFTAVTAGVSYSFVLSGVNKLTGSAIRRTGTVLIGAGVTAATALTTTGYLGFSYGDNIFVKNLRYYVIWADAAAATQMVLYACQEHFLGRIESAIFMSTVLTLTAAQVADASATALGSIGANVKLLERAYDANC